MRIYNRKKFAAGIGMVALGMVNFAMDLANKTVDGKGLLLAAALLLFGGGAIGRSLSQKMTREDRMEDLDERNRLIEWKSQSKAFRLTQSLSFSLMLALLVAGKVSGYEGFIAMGVGLAFACSISMFAEIFTYMYYESKN
ncbi:MAG: hypothetical protein KH050_07285 [Clostridiaceae bacterium]|nr:hypothetical protein [Clostridiaceae bacterium]